MTKLRLGETGKGNVFEIPADAVAQTFAIMGIRGSGKTTAAVVLAEEMCRARLPWICLDPVGVWWGIRATKLGAASAFPVVVIGGERGDIPLEKTAGRKIAEALIADPVHAVIDLSRESKKTWRQFVTDFCLALMDLNPDVPRHIFIEEAPEFVPQRTKVNVTARCKEAVERLVRLGRNRGYGCTLISQRPATVDKDVLSQAANIFALRTVGAHDRKALLEWVNEKGADGAAWTDRLAELRDGEAWFYSPSWMHNFLKVRFRDRTTYHPGQTRTAKSGRSGPVTLADVEGFVRRLRAQLTQAPPSAPAPAQPKVPSPTSMASGNQPSDTDTAPLRAELTALRERLDKLTVARAEVDRRLAAVRRHLQPQYDALRALFEDLGTVGGNGTADPEVWGPWLEKAGGGKRRRALEILIERKRVTRQQLATLSGHSPRSSTYRNTLSWLRTNGLAAVGAEEVTLNEP